MKLNIEELAREGRLFGMMRFDDGLGRHVLTDQAETFTRLIVERCAAICDQASLDDAQAFECAERIRKLLEAE